jgi:hypothetical protein
MKEAGPSNVSAVDWEWLHGRLWHATTLRGWAGICADRTIRPDLAEAAYKSALCRLIGAVSLFDFSGPIDGIDEAARDWQAWLCGRDDRVRIWIEISRPKTATSVIGPEDLRERYRRNLETREFQPAPRFIQFVEAGHHGPVPFDCFTGVMLSDHPRQPRWCEDLASVSERAATFVRAAPPLSDFGARMLAARRAAANRVP